MKSTHHSSRKGQISQVFVWIIVALVIGATALFGVRSIGGLLEDKCSVDLVQFENKIDSMISLNNDFGAVNAQTLVSPCDYTVVCLVDPLAIEASTIDFNPDLKLPRDFFPIIESSVIDGVEENVFLFNQKELIPAGYVPELRLEDSTTTLCINARGGRFNLLLEGKGRTTLVKEKIN